MKKRTISLHQLEQKLTHNQVIEAKKQNQVKGGSQGVSTFDLVL